MQALRTIYGGGAYRLKLKTGETIANAGTITRHDTTANIGHAINASTTAYLDSWGISLDSATHTTTQADIETLEGVVTVDARPDTVIRARISGSSTTGADMTTLSNTSADTAGLTITDADVGTASMVSGLIWGLSGANVGQSRVITTFNSAQDFVVTVPFPETIASGDTFLWAPFTLLGGGGGAVQTTGSDFLEADGSIASGTGGASWVVHVEMNEADNSFVQFVNVSHAMQAVGGAA